jgi:hypothetical protein
MPGLAIPARGHVVQTLGQIDGHPAAGEAAFGQCAKGTPRRPEEDALAVLQPPYAIDAGDERQFAGAAVMGAICQRFHDRMKTGGRNRHKLFSLGGYGIVKRQITWGSVEGLNNRSVHGRLLGFCRFV